MKPAAGSAGNYSGLVVGIAELLESARRFSARAVNAVMTVTYWEVGRRIVEFEQGGKMRAEYGHALLKKGGWAKTQDTVTPEEEIKDPVLLEFLGLKDEYSESQLEEALIRDLESFLLELGGDAAKPS